MPNSEIEYARLLYRSGAAIFAPTGDVTVNTDQVPASIIAYLSNNGMLVDGEVAPHAKELLKYLQAEDRVKQAWDAQGGPMGGLGLPINGAISLRGEDGDWLAEFGSGTIRVLHHETATRVTRVLHVDFVGLECVQRQERQDEVYGVVGVIGASNKMTGTYAFPSGSDTLTMGPDGARIQNFVEKLYEGPVENIVLVGTLIEHDDFENVDAAAEMIAEKIQSTVATALGGLVGLPAEAIAGQSDFKDAIADGLSFVMGDILGMGDDPYEAQPIEIPWTQMGTFGPPPQPPVVWGDDPKKIPHWTHKIKLTGIDDGGDLGEYNLFFNIWIEEVSVTATIRHDD